MSPLVHALFDERTWTLTYVVVDPATRDAVIIDSVLDFDNASGRVWRESAEPVLALVAKEELNVRLILETHAHPDHPSGAPVLHEALGAPVAIAAHITTVSGPAAR